MTKLKIILSIVVFFVAIMALDLGTGYFGVLKTKTVEKAQMNADREVFEMSQSMVEGKRQEAVKSYKEWKRADSSDKVAIEEMVAHSFANFDEQKLLTEPLKSFVYNCKY